MQFYLSHQSPAGPMGPEEHCVSRKIGEPLCSDTTT